MRNKKVSSIERCNQKKCTTTTIDGVYDTTFLKE